MKEEKVFSIYKFVECYKIAKKSVKEIEKHLMAWALECDGLPYKKDSIDTLENGYLSIEDWMINKSEWKPYHGGYKFSFGDFVKVIDTGETYNTYSDWFKETNNKRWLEYFKNGKIPQKNQKYRIVARGKHRNGDRINLYAIQDIKTERVYLIGEDGIEMYKEESNCKEEPSYTTDLSNLKVGDYVKIREWDDMKKEFGAEYGYIECNGKFIQEMKICCGKIIKINKKIESGRFCVFLTERYPFYSFSTDMFVGHKPILDKEEEEYNESILDKVEKEYLSAVIKPFRNEVYGIIKVKKMLWNHFSGYYYIKIVLKNEVIILPNFRKEEKMYQGMDEDKEYTLEELGL